MPNFAASLWTLFSEQPLPDRFRAARDAGFEAVEVQFPYEAEPEVLARARADAGVEVVILNTPMGDPAKGELGFAAVPGRQDDFRAGVIEARRYAEALGCRLVHVLAGAPGPEADREACLDLYAENLAWAGEQLEPAGVGVLVEPINDRDRPDYFIHTSDQAIAAIARSGRSNVGLLCDVYHLAMMGEEIVPTVARLKDAIGHVQFADAPGRHEPGTGDVDFRKLFRALDVMGYAGRVGAEYLPSGRTEDSLSWFDPYRSNAS